MFQHLPPLIGLSKVAWLAHKMFRLPHPRYPVHLVSKAHHHFPSVSGEKSHLAAQELRMITPLSEEDSLRDMQGVM